ncbi:MAG: YCF48-related protein [candidate division WOR-3 bacterium]
MRKFVINCLLFLLISGVFSGHLLLARNYHGSAIAPNGRDGWVCAIDTNFVGYTPDCGLTWIDQSFPTERFFFDIFFLDSLKGWVGAHWGYIFYTEDGGNNWSIQTMGIAKWAARIFFIDDSCGWAACGGAIIGKTTDGGQYWEQVNLPATFPYDTADIYGIHFVNRRKGWFCTGWYPTWVNDTLQYLGGQGFIAYTNNGGDSWYLLKRDTVYDFFDIKFKDSLTGWVVGGNDRNMSAVVMKTQNGGISWTPLTIPSSAQYLRALELVGDRHLWAVGRNGTIIHSRDGGNTWVSQVSGVDTTLFDVDFADTLRGIIAGNGYVLYTHNGGNTWNIANVGIEDERLRLDATRTKLNIYPNPATSVVRVRAPFAVNKVTIYDVTGKVVKEVRTKDQKTIIYLNSIKEGVYFVVIESVGQRFNQKLVVKR